MSTSAARFPVSPFVYCGGTSFAAIAVLALALGVGPEQAIFGVIYATLYAPMPYRDA